MDVGDFIDQIADRTANVPASDAAYAKVRTRILEYLVQEFEWHWTARQWKRRRTSTTLTVSANAGYVDLPANFSSLGTEGGVWNVATGRELDEISEDALREIKERPGSGTSDPRFFSIYGMNTSDFTYQLQIENNTASVQLKVAYNIITPTLDEDTFSDNLKYIPEHFHQSVLIPAVRSRMLWQKGDRTWEEHERQRQAGLDHMVREERRRQGSPRQMPSFFGGRL